MPSSSRHRKKSSNVDENVRFYEEKRPHYFAFTGKLKVLLQDLLQGAEIKYHIIESRTKEVQSFREKITRANKRYTEPLKEVTDLSGLRIIVYYLEDVKAACKLIEREFSVDRNSSLDKGELLKPNEFGYRSVHYVASLLTTRAALPEWHSFAGLPAEIQIRTVLQHAWASISHTLDYKREVEVPVPLRRKLSRIAGLLELSDEEFSDLRREERDFSAGIYRKLSRGTMDIELDAVSLAGYLEASNTTSLIVAEGRAAGFSFDFVDDTDSPDFSPELLELCAHVGITTVRQLDDALNSALPWIRRYLQDQFESHSGKYDGAVWGVDGVFLTELILIAQHADQVTVDYLLQRGWSSDVAESVVQAAQRVSANRS